MPGITVAGERLEVLQALNFSAVTITTLGYGDVTLQSTFAQLAASAQALMGVIVIGLFLNSLAHRRESEVLIEKEKQQEETRLKEEKLRLKNHHNLMLLRIAEYERRCLPITKPSASNPEKPNTEFEFSDMHELYAGTAMLTDDLFRPAIAYYFEAQQRLINEVVELMRNVDLHIWPELSDLCTEFVTKTQSLDFRGFILSAPDRTVGDKKMSDHHSSLIKNHTGPIDFKKSNAMNPYIALYFGIKNAFEFNYYYKSQVLKILDKKS
jgi:hypothetical protein